MQPHGKYTIEIYRETWILCIWPFYQERRSFMNLSFLPVYLFVSLFVDCSADMESLSLSFKSSMRKKSNAELMVMLYDLFFFALFLKEVPRAYTFWDIHVFIYISFWVDMTWIDLKIGQILRSSNKMVAQSNLRSYVADNSLVANHSKPLYYDLN